MDFGKEAIEKIEQLIKGSYAIQVDDKIYSAQDLKPVLYEPKAAAIDVSTLTGFVGFIERNIDDLDFENYYTAVVDDPGKVMLCSALSGEKRAREVLVNARLDNYMQTFPFGQFMPQEEFIIKLHSLFEKKEGDDFDYVALMVSKIVQADTADTDDDGITQHVTVKRGISGALKEKGEIKPIVRLSPYRTFREIAQPESQFLLRIKTSDNGAVQAALFEADGGAWRNEARLRIAAYLKEHIKVSVIA
jgi:hypothetical protein